MIATWMVYCVLCAVGLTLAAILAERVLLAGRGPVRGVWVSAVALSLIVPLVAYRAAQQRSDAPAIVSAGVGVVAPVGPADASIATAPSSAASATHAETPSWNWRAAVARIDRPLMIAWASLSAALLLYFVAGVIVLALMRRRWQQREVLGVRVFVSEKTGPAIVGAISPAIVVPEWVLEMEASRLALMLCHEQEHRRAGDGRLLAAAQLAVIAMPWNIALWWQVMRLRLAVELDCDARVLREGDARIYGDLLLTAARPQRPGLIGATAFAERAAQLERRIQVLARHRTHTSRVARAVAAGVGLVAVSVAWAAPRPAVSVHSPVFAEVPAVHVTPTRQPTVAVQPLPPAKAAPRVVEKKPVVTPVSFQPSDSAPRAVSLGSLGPCLRVGSNTSAFVDSLYLRLFDGIKLTSDQEVIACVTLINLEHDQAIKDQEANAVVAARQAQRVALETVRNAALRELLTTDADRAAFDASAAQAASGERGGGGFGRGGGAGARGAGGAIVSVVGDSAFRLMVARDTIAGGRERVGGGRAGGGGRVGGTGDVIRVAATVGQVMNQMTYQRLFNGITLTAEQQARAQEMIAKTQTDIQAALTALVIPPALLRVNPFNGAVLMAPESAEVLFSLPSNEADRTKLRERINVRR